MREIRPSGSEGGVALTRHPYPYQDLRTSLRPGRRYASWSAAALCRFATERKNTPLHSGGLEVWWNAISESILIGSRFFRRRMSMRLFSS
jgi:hypothetical protein